MKSIFILEDEPWSAYHKIQWVELWNQQIVDPRHTPPFSSEPSPWGALRFASRCSLHLTKSKCSLIFWAFLEGFSVLAISNTRGSSQNALAAELSASFLDAHFSPSNSVFSRRSGRRRSVLSFSFKVLWKLPSASFTVWNFGCSTILVCSLDTRLSASALAEAETCSFPTVFLLLTTDFMLVWSLHCLWLSQSLHELLERHLELLTILRQIEAIKSAACWRPGRLTCGETGRPWPH